MRSGYYTQHRWRMGKPEHRVRIFLLGNFQGTTLVGTLQLDVESGKVLCDPESDARPSAIELLGEVWAWAGDGIPQTEEGL